MNFTLLLGILGVAFCATILVLLFLKRNQIRSSSQEPEEIEEETEEIVEEIKEPQEERLSEEEVLVISLMARVAQNGRDGGAKAIEAHLKANYDGLRKPGEEPKPKTLTATEENSNVIDFSRYKNTNSAMQSEPA